MDIVIPYKLPSHRETELIFALRSIETYLKGYDRIFIIGDRPNLNKNIFHLQANDIKGKERSIMNKLLLACDLNISEDFIYWNDDHYLLKPLNVSDFKYWHNGSLKNELSRARGDYKAIVENTLRATPGFNYDIHVPLVINKTEFKSRTRLFNWGREQYTLKTIYCQGKKGEFMEDCKINFTLPKERIKEKIKGRMFFSTGPFGICKDMIDVLNELYPNPSKYELV